MNIIKIKLFFVADKWEIGENCSIVNIVNINLLDIEIAQIISFHRLYKRQIQTEEMVKFNPQYI